VAALLTPDLFREGADGEALRWAAARLEAVQAQRRILLVFSDGSPMDGATVLANDTYYLDRDLQATAQRIERAGQIELRGVGLGLDLSAFYARSVVLDMQNHRSAHTLGEILTLLRPRA
jgi:cobaltochelatase CobT